MTKLIKIAGHFTLFVYECMLLLLILFAFLVRLPEVQTYIAKEAADYLSVELEAKIEIDKVDIAFFDRVYLHELYVEDQYKDTLVFIDELLVDVSLIGLRNKAFVLDYVRLNNPTFSLSKKATDSSTNMQFIVDYFKKESKKEPVDFTLKVHDFEINEGVFKWDDFHKESKPYGVDFAHLSTKNINLDAHSITITKDQYDAYFNSFSLNEKSGFSLTNFTSIASFSKQGLDLKGLSILTPHSTIIADYYCMETTDYSSYNDFVDEVKLSAKLTDSDVSLKDISMFAHALEGMDADVKLSADVENTIANLAISNTTIETGSSTKISGDFKLPDFRDSLMVFEDQELKKLSVNVADVSSMRLPVSASSSYLTLPDQLMEIGFIEGESMTLSGNTERMVLSLNTLETALGELSFKTPIELSNKENFQQITLKPVAKTNRWIELSNFHLGKLIANDQFGKLNGSVGFEMEYVKEKHLKLNKMRGYLKGLNVLDYTYRHILLEKIALNVDLTKKSPKTTIDGVFYVRDPNLDLSYSGKTSFGEKIDLAVDIHLECAELARLHHAFEDRGRIAANFKMNGSGRAIKDFSGTASIDTLFYQEGEDYFSVDHLEARLSREEKRDHLIILSDLVDLELDGHANIGMVMNNIVYQASAVFPAFFTEMDPVFDPNSIFEYTVNIKNLNPVLAIFAPDFEIANNTMIDGMYNGDRNLFGLNVETSFLSYKDITYSQIYIRQEMSEGQLLALYKVGDIYYKDSIVIKDVHFTNLASNNNMDSHLLYHTNTGARSSIEWLTHIKDTSNFDLQILPSYFTVNDNNWRIEKEATLKYEEDKFKLDYVRIEREEQYIVLDGIISTDPDDELNIDINNLDLNDVAIFFIPERDVRGVANVNGSINDIFNHLRFEGSTELKDLYFDENQIGDVFFDAAYDPIIKSLKIQGDVNYREMETFAFDGAYWLEREDDKLDLKMIFNHTDISLVNAFLGDQVVTDIGGNIVGELDVKGTFNSPELNGVVDLKKGKAHLSLLGADFNYEGQLVSNADGIFINTMPVTDNEGNTGFIVGHVFHDNFSNFMYELSFNFEDHPYKRNPNDRSKPKKIDRFKVMKTRYTEESLYYGDAYLTGTANVSGMGANIDISVNAKTEKGTWVNFPMYGGGKIEEDGFIKFKSVEDELDSALVEKGIDFTGVNLALNFEVTPEAKVKLIFDDNVEDQITASGEGDLRIGLDTYGDVTLKGTYKVMDGVYNFAMGPYKQNFFIVPGGTVQWTGSPYSAILDIETYYKTNANLSVVMTDLMDNRISDNEEIYSYLKLRGDMRKPEISFDLAAPNANDAGKSVINRIRGDQEELNRQFFSLLIWRRFQPLAGQEGNVARGGSGGAALDLVSTQINSMLSKVSDDYKMNVALESDDVTGESSVEFGVTKGFMDDRLIVSGSFGVGSHASQETANQNNLIGDLRLEYLLNEKGTFRINAFNESNANTVIQNTNQGQFTQGFGINYREDFYNLRDFKAFLFIADMLRKDKQLEYRDYSRYKPIPEDRLKEAKEEEEEKIENEEETQEN